MLETKTFRRLGGTREITVDVRLVAATNKDLQKEVEELRFREDLYYRLSVMPLQLPAVRDRSREDRLALITRLHDRSPGRAARRAADAARARCSTACSPITGRATCGRCATCWSGRSSSVAARTAVSVEHLPGEFRARPGIGDRRHTPLSLEDLERQHIERTLKHHTGNRTRAAIELGISRATLINKIKRYNLTA